MTRQGGLTPRAFGRYEVRRPLGEGGFGAVYLAHDPVLSRDVAIKVPKDAWWAGEDVLAEARALARLRHPAVVQVLDVGRSPLGAFIVLEYVDGQDLETLLSSARARRGTIEPPAALALLRGPAAAVDHAHSHGILHRDIKPGNLLVPKASLPDLPPPLGTFRGGTAVELREPVKIADFGLHALAAERSHGGAAGDPQYAAPEAWRGSADRASDVFSLAAVFFRLVAGRPPLAGGTPAETIAAAGRPERARLRDVRKDLPLALDEAMASALSPRRHERPPHAAALIDRIENALARDNERQRLVRDARQRIEGRQADRRRASCPECRRPLHPMADTCQHCGTSVT